MSKSSESTAPGAEPSQKPPVAESSSTGNGGSPPAPSKAKASSRPSHTCHWPGCPKEVAPKLWGCSYHWFKLLPTLRRNILAAYVPGQERTKKPSPEYLLAAQAAQTWIKTLQS